MQQVTNISDLVERNLRDGDHLPLKAAMLLNLGIGYHSPSISGVLVVNQKDTLRLIGTYDLTSLIQLFQFRKGRVSYVRILFGFKLQGFTDFHTRCIGCR